VNGTSDDVINNSEKTAVTFTVAGLDIGCDDGRLGGRDLHEQRRRVGAEDPGPAAIPATRVDLSTLSDGTVTESMLITDAAGEQPRRSPARW